MKKKNSKDNLEDLFRSLLNDAKKVHQPQGWNVPPADAWDNIQTELSKKQKEERKFLYWHWLAAAASALLLLCVFQLYESNQQIENLSKELIENDQVVRKIQSELQALNDKKIAEIQPKDSQKEEPSPTKHLPEVLNLPVPSDKKSSIQETTAFNNVDANKNIIISEYSLSASSNKNLEEATSKIAPALVLTNKKENSSKHMDLALSFLQIEKDLNSISIVESLPMLIPPLELKQRTNNWTNSIITPIAKKRSKFYISLDYAPVLTPVRERVAELDKNEFPQRRKRQETAYNTGLHFGVKREKGWSLETGLRFLSVKEQVQHNRRIPYDFLQERLNGNGDYESNLNLQLISSAGTIDTDISLARSSASTVASDANINMDITFTSKRNYLEVPLIVKKEWAIGSFALSLKAGLLNRFLLNKSFELGQISIEDTRFNPTTNNFRERPSSRSTGNYAVDYLAGLGVAYAIRPQLSFYVEPTFIRAMQPRIGFRGASNYRKSKMLNVGLRYIL